MIVCYLWITVFTTPMNRLLWISMKRERIRTNGINVPRGTCPHFLATGYRIRARENSIRPYLWFHSLFTLSPFCPATSIPHASFSFLRIVASIRFHPMSLFAFPFPHLPHRQSLCPWCRPVDIATCLAESFRHAPVKVSAKRRSAAGSCD